MASFAFCRRCLFILGALFVAVALAFFFVHQSSEKAVLVEQARHDLAEARSGMEEKQREDTRLLSACLEPLLRDEALRAAFLARDRKRLNALAQPLFAGFKARYGITHFYFLDPPPSSTCFLRVHSPQLYGDKIERATYLGAVKTGDFSSGLELGQTAFALRVVHPWYSRDGKRVIGYLELGEEINHFMGALKARTEDDYALLLDKHKLDSVIWMHMRNAMGLANDWSDRALYVLAQDTGVAVRDLEWNGSLDKLPEGGKVLGLDRKDGIHLMRAVFPVKDAAGQRSGAVLVARDVTVLVNHSQWRHMLSVALVMLALVVIGIMAGWLLAQPDDSVKARGYRGTFGPLWEAFVRSVRQGPPN